MTTGLSSQRSLNIAILVAALGYFVDCFDLVLFSVVRIESLKSLGISGDDLLTNGVFLLNIQMVGMLLGGVLWGIYGDKRGRIQVLFGSILLYSVANILNSFVDTIPAYAAFRFLAGIGLAGEVGAGITLVSELMPKESRGYATTLVATVGVSGAIAAGLVGDLFDWRTAYIIGGVAGLCLLVLRISVNESGMFSAIKNQDNIRKGDFKMLFRSRERFLRYLSCILIATPVWFVVGVLVAFTPEIGASLGVTEPLKVAYSAICYSIGITVGDLASGLLSQIWGSRKRVIRLFVSMTLIFSLIMLSIHGQSATQFYGSLILLGFFIGYWAVFVTTAAEQFGTNLRATVATSAPNFVRGTTVLMTLLFNTLKGHVGVATSAQIVGGTVCLLALFSLTKLPETFGRDLDFLETDQTTEPVSAEDQRRLKVAGW